MDYDRIFKELLPAVLADLVFAQTGKRMRIAEQLITEFIVNTNKHIDFLFLLVGENGEVEYLHVEVQSAHDPTMHQHMMLYGALI